MSKRIKILIIIFLLISVLYLIVLLYINNFSSLRNKLYLPRKTNVYPRIGNDIKVQVPNKNRLINGLLSINGKKLIVLFHGNGAIINDFEFITKLFYNKGYSTLLIEYPGYGLSYQYKVTERNIYSDSEKIIKYVQKEYNFNKANTYFFGWSLGTGVATEMSKRGLSSKMVLVSSFTSLPDVANEKFLKIIPYFIILDRFSTKYKAKYIHDPVLLIHGTKDRLIPYNMSVKLSKLFKNAKLITIKNADHANIFKYLNKSNWNEIYDFLK